jgi:hypothetical protein
MMIAQSKRCPKCGQTDEIEKLFHKNKSRKDGYQSICKECMNKKSKSNSNKKENKTKKLRNLHDILLRNKQFVLDYLNEHPCIDCGESDPVVLEFDHKENKSFGISMIGSRTKSISTIQKEINKCDVRCGNCHRKKTAKDFGYFKEKLK